MKRHDIGGRVALSSAAGGLRMVAIGLVPDLTAEAARRAALGAGARVLGVFAYDLARRDLEDVAQIAPDMILLAGGTDGGDQKTILRNARALATLGLDAPIVLAGDRTAQDEVKAVLEVVTLGVLVSQDEFVKAAVEVAADAILVSSLYGDGELDCPGLRDRCVEAGKSGQAAR